MFCDRCTVARAAGVANKGAYELAFCRHHLAENIVELQAQGWEITPLDATVLAAPALV